MGVLKFPILLVFLMLLLLTSGSDAKTCKEASKTYTSKRCQASQCAEACQKEEFTEGICKGGFPFVSKKCVCKKKC
nr:defensin-like protein 5 [Lolium perenne]